MTYTVFARKYRPKLFRELHGQEPIVTTIKNAFMQKRIPHAFMLTGIRGTGKTTIARLIARTLNCSSLHRTDTDIEPCGTCDNCKSALEGRHVDIIEVDAASRTGVDDVRELIEGVSYTPVMGAYKVYIIDEVHMLSKSAFNALLKTLEEPPAHVTFIFATTEMHKIPLTVLSRCQRFLLKRISTEAIHKLLDHITKQENLHISEDAIHHIANATEGSARDALSLLDQAVLVCGQEITEEGLLPILGTASANEIRSLLHSLLEGHAETLIADLQSIVDRGVPAEGILKSLLHEIHTMTLSKTQNDVAKLMRLWQVLFRGLEDLRHGSFSYIALEMLLLRAIHLKDILLPKHLKIFTEEVAPTKLSSFEDIIHYLKSKGHMLLASQLAHHVHVVSFAQGNITLRLKEGADTKHIDTLTTELMKLTGTSWNIDIVTTGGTPTLVEQKEHAVQQKYKEAERHPLTQELHKLGPGKLTIEESET